MDITVGTVTDMEPVSSVVDIVHDQARRARGAAKAVASLSTEAKNSVLRACADALIAHKADLLAANAHDMAAAGASGMEQSLQDRLLLTSARIDSMVNGLHIVVSLTDPIGQVMQGYTVPNGLRMQQVRVPLGVVGIVYEARPNVTVDAFAIAFKSGNAALLRGSLSAQHSNAALVQVIQSACHAQGVPADVVQLLPSSDRSSVSALVRARGLVDVVIPRGGAGLINAVVAEATVPTIETGVGNCHIYVHADAQLDMAETIIINAKTRRPSVCNTVETILIDAAIADTFLPILMRSFTEYGVTVHGDELGMIAATEKDWAEEYLSLDIAVKIVPDLAAAIEHIDHYGTGHTEAIITDSLCAAEEFTQKIDCAAVMVNASTAFTDGEQFGFGAEIGISTQKLHARGPMGLDELTSTKWIVHGHGHIRPI